MSLFFFLHAGEPNSHYQYVPPLHKTPPHTHRHLPTEHKYQYFKIKSSPCFLTPACPGASRNGGVVRDDVRLYPVRGFHALEQSNGLVGDAALCRPNNPRIMHMEQNFIQLHGPNHAGFRSPCRGLKLRVHTAVLCTWSLCLRLGNKTMRGVHKKHHIVKYVNQPNGLCVVYLEFGLALRKQKQCYYSRIKKKHTLLLR